MASIEFWMHACPRRWRQTRGQELVDLVVDLAGPGARRLDAHAAFDLVHGGTPEGIRSRARLKHVAPRFAEVPVEGAPVAANVTRQRVTARSGMS